ncbi:hypothetical protein MJO52_03025 [Microbulbifer variabilis]|uniref:Uncharacterized protein n=1 Tax=Microbulbifer variabilis TaxID=266805 RepID=A0ABY4VDB3_9GAMM|nr:hypothetical protein [Microbulbifer variabilis]USD22122.1 hypothetical protein MJO52_03025 [Microbulbifer variabilis]
MAKRKPRKPMSKQAQHARLVNRWLPGLVLTARSSTGLDTDGDPILDISHRRQGGAVGDIARAKLQHEILNWQHHWLVTVFVECKTPKGERYTDSTEFEARGVRLNDLAELVRPELDNIQNQANPNHYKDHGWQAEILLNRKQEKGRAA